MLYWPNATWLKKDAHITSFNILLWHNVRSKISSSFNFLTMHLQKGGKILLLLSRINKAGGDALQMYSQEVCYCQQGITVCKTMVGISMLEQYTLHYIFIPIA